MKLKYILSLATVLACLSLAAQEKQSVENQYSKYIENGVVPVADKTGISFSTKAYLLNMRWTSRMMRDPSEYFTAWGAYAQAGYFVAKKVQVAARYDFYDRNGIDTPGLLNMPAVGANYFFAKNNLKLQVMYQYIGKMNHETQTERDNDDTGMAYHSVKTMLQFTF